MRPLRLLPLAACIALAHAPFLLPSLAHAQSAVRFNGTSQYVTFGLASSLGTPTFTLELWFKREGVGVATSTGAGGVVAIPLIAKGRAEADASTRDMNYFLGIRGDSILVLDFEEGTGQTNPGLNHPIAGITKIRNNVWYHAAATFNGTQMRLYLNGNLEKDTTLAANRRPQSASIQHASLATAITSASATPPITPDGFFNGTIDEPRIWAHARPEQGIRDSMGLQITSAPGLIGRWGLNENMGTAAANSGSGASANGTLSPTATPPLWVAGSAFVVPSAALKLGGSNAYATFGNAAALGLAEFTLETWFRRDGPGVTTSTGTGGIDAVPLITKGTGEADMADDRDMNYFFGIGPGAVLAADFEEGATGASPSLNHPVLGTTQIVNGTWYHAAATYDGTRWRLYLNGSLEAESIVGQPPRSTSIQHSGLGTALESDGSPEGFLNGLMDETRIWNFARSPADIVADMNAQIASPRAGLVGRWALDEGGGSVIRGSAGTGINGNLLGTFGWNDPAPFNALPPTPPNAPSGLTATAQTFGSIRLQWSDNSGNETRFLIERSASSGGPFDSLASVGAGVTSYVDAGLAELSQHCYRVRAINGVGPSAPTSAECATTPAEGSAALDFSGTNGFVSFGNAAALGLEQFTLECWFRRDGPGVTANTGAGGVLAVPLITKGVGEVDQEDNRDANYFLGIRGTDNVLVADFEEGGTGASPGLNHPVIGVTPIATGVWHHVAVTYDTLSWRLYLDGNLERELLVDEPPRANSIQHAALGSALQSTGDSTGFFDGAIDEARVWNVARTPSEIQGAINAEYKTKLSGLVTRWGLNENSGTIINGVSGVSGTIRGTGWSWTSGAPFNMPAPVLPSAPAGLLATALTDAQIRLDWTDTSNNEFTFEIERSSTGVGGPFSLAGSVSANQGTFTDTGLDPLAQYCYRVRAVNPVGPSGFSGVACAATADEINSALDLGTGRAFVTFGDPAALDLPRFTVETWFRRDGPGIAASTGSGGIDAIPLVTKGTAEDDGSNVDMNFFLGISSGGLLAADFEEGALGSTPGLNHPIQGITPIVNGVWYHGAVAYDGTTIQIFLNGSLEAQEDVGEPVQFNSIQPAALGTGIQSDGDSVGFFDGVLDEARIWDYARTEEQIQTLLNTPARGSMPGLVARWGLNEGAGNVVRGSAGTTVNGSIRGAGYTWVAGAPFNIVIEHAPAPPTNESPPDQATGVPTSPTLSVDVSDVDGDPLSVTFYGRAVSGTAGPDFTLIGLPDTQYYTSGLNGATPAQFDAQTQWIVANRAGRNIVDVVQLGDCTEHGDNNGNDVEWRNADRSLGFLENPTTTGLPNGIPYGVCVGNHDQSPNGNPDGTTTFYNQYFGEARFSGRPYYGGHVRRTPTDTNNDNHFHLFSASGLDFMVICFEYDTTPDAPVLRWADSLLTAHAGRRAIVASHYLINAGNPGTFGAQGQAVYNALRAHPNLFLMLCGHVTPPEGRRTDTYNGNTVHTVLSDYQSQGPSGASSSGGGGWLRIYEFSPAHNVIRVRTYSPVLGQFYADADSSSQFTLPYDMGGGGAFQPIATVNVPSGSTASTPWPGLLDGTAYEWYATVSDGHRTVSGPIRRFATVDGASPSAHVIAPNGGEAWATSSHQTIRWTATDNLAVSNVDLAYSTDGGATYPNAIATGIANTGTYDWVVPVAIGTTVRVRIIAHDAAGNTGTDASDANFRITDGERPSVTVVAPNGGESWLTGSPQTITWTAADNIGVTAIDIALSTNGGASFPTAIATGIANSGSFAWTTPGTVTPAARIRIIARDAAGNTARDSSDVNFALTDGTAPQVTVNSPNGGESWSVGTSHNITWTATDNGGVTAIDLALSTDGGATFPTPIATGIANSGSFPWVVPNSPTTQARVRVTAHDAATNVTSDASNGDFTITAVAPVTNLCGNPDFETNLAGWGAYGSATLSRVTGGHSGFAMQIQNLSSGSFGCDDIPDWISGLTQTGQTYRFQAWVKSATGHTGVVKIRVYEFQGGTQVGSTAYSNQPALTPNWQLLSIDYPVRGPGHTISMKVTDATGPQTFLVDDVLIRLLTAGADAAPVVSAPATAAATPGTQLTLNVTASDPDGQAISTLNASGVPAGATFSTNASRTSGTLLWTPAPADVRAAPYNVTFTASNALSGSATTAITVSAAPPPPPPSANLCGNPDFETNLAGWGTYNSAVLSRVPGGRTGFAMQIANSSSGSFGCDDVPDWISTPTQAGQVYRFQAWVKSATGHTGVVKIRVYEFQGGTQVGSTAYSNQPALTANWQLLTLDYPVRGVGNTISMKVTDATGPETFLVDDILIRSVGSAASPFSSQGSTGSAGFSASFAPNPAAGSGTLTFVTSRVGRALVEVFDPHGRRVAKLLDVAELQPGRHTLGVEAPSETGGRVPSGLYFYRVQADEGVLRGRFVMMR